jgi:hypothetical protein
MPELQKGKYRHYKGRLYEVLDVARHSETLEEMVVYRTLYSASELEADTTKNGEQTLWVRPLRMFTENVVVDGKLIPRFAFEH